MIPYNKEHTKPPICLKKFCSYMCWLLVGWLEYNMTVNCCHVVIFLCSANKKIYRKKAKIMWKIKKIDTQFHNGNSTKNLLKYGKQQEHIHFVCICVCI